MANNSLDHLYILHKRPYSNSSLLLECFSSDLGRFPAIVKGAKTKKGMVGLLQPFQALLGKVTGRSEIKNLYHIELLDQPCLLTGNNLFFAFYINELLMYLLPRQDSMPTLFELYKNLMHDLYNSHDIENLLRHFEVQLLTQLGYGLLLTKEADTDLPIMAENIYDYQIEYGAIACEHSMLNATQGSTLLALANKTPLNHSQKNQAKRLMKRIMQYYLNGKPLKSRELFQPMRPSNEQTK